VNYRLLLRHVDDFLFLTTNETEVLNALCILCDRY